MPHVSAGKNGPGGDRQEEPGMHKVRVRSCTGTVGILCILAFLAFPRADRSAGLAGEQGERVGPDVQCYTTEDEVAKLTKLLASRTQLSREVELKPRPGVAFLAVSSASLSGEHPGSRDTLLFVDEHDYFCSVHLGDIPACLAGPEGVCFFDFSAKKYVFAKTDKKIPDVFIVSKSIKGAVDWVPESEETREKLRKIGNSVHLDLSPYVKWEPPASKAVFIGTPSAFTVYFGGSKEGDARWSWLSADSRYDFPFREVGWYVGVAGARSQSVTITLSAIETASAPPRPAVTPEGLRAMKVPFIEVPDWAKAKRGFDFPEDHEEAKRCYAEIKKVASGTLITQATRIPARCGIEIPAKEKAPVPPRQHPLFGEGW
jgi:hypothetical protein